MSNNFSFSSLSGPKNSKFSNIDGLIKCILATVLACMPFLVKQPVSLDILFIYLLIVTFISGIKLQTLIISAISYCIVFLIPYFFGLLMSSLLYLISGNDVFAYHQGFYEIFLRLSKLFFIWYVSILYFHTTPMKTVVGLLDKLLTPLKLMGFHVADYLKVVMCIVLELTAIGVNVKKSLGESMRSALGPVGWRFKINIKGISQIIVSLIVNSFEKLERIESFVEKANVDDLYNYKFKLSKSDVISVVSFILLISLVFIIEKGYWV